MRASEHDDAHFGVDERPEVPFDGQTRNFPFQPPFFYERHQERRRLAYHIESRRELANGPRVSARRDGARRSEDTDASAPRVPCPREPRGDVDGRHRAGLDDADDR